MKSITAAQPEWLYWLSPPGCPAQLRVRRSYVLAGLMVQVENELVTLSGSRGAAGKLLALPVRAGAVSGAQQVSVALYDVATGEALSPLARFALVPATDRTRYLVFTNSLGTLDTFRCEGPLVAALEAKTDVAELPARFGAGVAEQAVLDVTATRKLKLATGWLKPEELTWLQELAFAREVWLHRPGLGLLPLDLARRSLVPHTDVPTLRGLLLEFDYAFAPTAHANF